MSSNKEKSFPVLHVYDQIEQARECLIARLRGDDGAGLRRVRRGLTMRPPESKTNPDV